LTGEDPGPPPTDAEGTEEVPTQAFEDPGEATISIAVEAAFPEIRRLKMTGSILFALSGTFVLLPTILEGEGLSSLRGIATVVLAVTGIVFGIAGFVAPAARRFVMYIAPALLVASAAASPLGASLDRIPTQEMLPAFAFAITWLLAVEHLHAVMRFVELGAYVTRQRLSSFQLSSVVNHFQVYGLGLAGLIVLVTVIVVIGIPWVFGQGQNELFGHSVELGSVFGIAISAAIVFTLAGMILVFVRSVMPQRVDVERVAYSRGTMEDMLRSARLMETTQSQLNETPGRKEG
jgi:hypothetical protein